MNHKRKRLPLQSDSYHMIIILIGMLNILVINSMVSLNGSGYIGLSLFLFWLIASACSLWYTGLTSKMIRQKQSQGKSAGSFWKAALLCNIIPNVLLALWLFFFSESISQFLFLNKNMSFCVKIVALSLFPFGLSCLLCGYLKGIGFHRPVRLVILIQQILIFVFSVSGLLCISDYGEKASLLLNNKEVIAVYKATGALAGALAGMTAGILFLCIFLLILRKNQAVPYTGETMKNYIPFRSELQSIVQYGLSHVIFSLTVLLVPLIDFTVYIRSDKTVSDISEIMQTSGIIFSVLLPFLIIALTLWRKLCFTFEHDMRNALRDQNFRLFKDHVFGILHGCMAVMLPASILLVILSEAVLKLLFGSAVLPDHVTLFRTGSILVFFFSYVIALLQILKLIGMSPVSVLFSMISFIFQTALCGILISLYGLGIRGFFGAVYAFVILDTVLLLWYLRKRVRFSFLLQKPVLLNAVLALFTGFLIFMLYQYVCSAWQPLAAIFVCVLFYLAVYIAGMAVLPVMEEEDSDLVPGAVLFLQVRKLFYKEDRGA